MTAYACCETADQDLSVFVEIRTYNSRHLDVVLRLPSTYAGMEEKIKRVIGERVVRGRVEVRLQVKDLSESAYSFDVDLAKAKAYQEALQGLKNGLKLPDPVGWDQILGIPGIITAAEENQKADNHWPVLESCLQQTLQALDKMRKQEGDFIQKDFLQRLQFIQQALDRIATSAKDLPAVYRDKLQMRIEALTQGLVELDTMRIAQEAAILADRSDIAEEIVRARSHLDQFRKIINGKEPAGRKLNFLLQELNREFNTMGAKVGQAEIAHVIVDVKAEFEKIREQVQNIE